MTPTNTAELRALLEKATPGPVRAEKDNTGSIIRLTSKHEPIVACLWPCVFYADGEYRSRTESGTLDDANYIAALLNAAPAMIDELEKARARINALQIEASELRKRIAAERAQHEASIAPLVHAASDAMSMRPLVIEVDRAALDPRKQGAEL